MKKKILAMVLAAVMALSIAPVNAVNAASASLISTNESSAKVSKVTGIKVAGTTKGDNFALKYSWKKLSGVKYQYRYKTADTADYSKVKTTKSTKATVSFPSYGEVTFQVRAVKTVDGKKVTGAWATKKLSSKKVDKILSKALGIKDGYLKNGVRFEGGLYSNDGKTDLDIAIFISGASKDNVVYIIRENGKIVDYGMDITATTDKLSDGTEYVKLACKVGEAQKDATYGYNFEKSFLVTSTGAKVSAVEISDPDYAWNIQKMAE